MRKTRMDNVTIKSPSAAPARPRARLASCRPPYTAIRPPRAPGLVIKSLWQWCARAHSAPAVATLSSGPLAASQHPDFSIGELALATRGNYWLEACIRAGGGLTRGQEPRVQNIYATSLFFFSSSYLLLILFTMCRHLFSSSAVRAE